MKFPAILLSLSLLLCSCSGRPDNATLQSVEPEIFPTLSGATLPVNIAAPSFRIEEEADEFYTEIGIAGQEPSIAVKGRDVCPPLKKWHKLLGEASGGSIYYRIYARIDSRWLQYADIVCPVSEYPVDRYLVYRLLYPGYELWNRMGIYQRDLMDYTQTPVIENSSIDRQCINCHSFADSSPQTMMIHVRGPKGGTVIRRNGSEKKVNPKVEGMQNGATYPAWHPSGRYIAFSANDIRQYFHSSGQKTIEVSDLSSDMTLYDVEADKAVTIPGLAGEEWMETFPTWSPDGKTLYFCRAKGYEAGTALDSIRYDLCSIGFNPATGNFGEPTTLVNAADNGQSISFPRVSPDGRYLLYTLATYGNFSIWHPESDLWLLDLKNGATQPLTELNSDDVESYHSWSSNGRWIVFSSKRLDGLWSVPFIASFENGKTGKPFPLPQQNPDFYRNFMLTYNLPEFITAPIADTENLVDAANR